MLYAGAFGLFMGASHLYGLYQARCEVQKFHSHCNEQVAKVERAVSTVDVEGVNEALSIITSEKDLNLSKVLADQLRGRLSLPCQEKLEPVIHWMISVISGGYLGSEQRQVRDVTKFLVRMTFQQEKLSKELGSLKALHLVLSQHEESEKLTPILKDLEERIQCIESQVAVLEEETCAMRDALAKFFEEASFVDKDEVQDLLEGDQVEEMAYDLVNRLPAMKQKFQTDMHEINQRNIPAAIDNCNTLLNSEDPTLRIYLPIIQNYYEAMQHKEPEAVVSFPKVSMRMVHFFDTDNTSEGYKNWFHADNGHDPIGNSPFSHYCIPEAFQGLMEDGGMLSRVYAPMSISPQEAEGMMGRAVVIPSEVEHSSVNGQFDDLPAMMEHIFEISRGHGAGKPIDFSKMRKDAASAVKKYFIKVASGVLHATTKYYYRAKDYNYEKSELVVDTWMTGKEVAPEIINPLIYHVVKWEKGGWNLEEIEQDILDWSSGKIKGNTYIDQWANEWIPTMLRSPTVVGSRPETAYAFSKVVNDLLEGEQLNEEEGMKCQSLLRVLAKVGQRNSHEAAQVVCEASKIDDHAAANIISTLLPSGADTKEAVLKMGAMAQYYEQNPHRLEAVMEAGGDVIPLVEELKPTIIEGIEEAGRLLEEDPDFKAGVQDLKGKGLNYLSGSPEDAHVVMMMGLKAIATIEHFKKEEPWESYAEVAGPEELELLIYKSIKDCIREVNTEDLVRDTAESVKTLVQNHGKSIREQQKAEQAARELRERQQEIVEIDRSKMDPTVLQMFDRLPPCLNPMLSPHERIEQQMQRFGLKLAQPSE